MSYDSETLDTLIDTLWELSLDGSWESTGDTSWDVWAALMPVSDELRTQHPILERAAYIVTQDDLGFKDVMEFDSETEAENMFRQLEQKYSDWAGENDVDWYNENEKEDAE